MKYWELTNEAKEKVDDMFYSWIDINKDLPLDVDLNNPDEIIDAIIEMEIDWLVKRQPYFTESGELI